jgi:hypothetical protein
MSNWFQKCFRQGFKNIGNSPILPEFDARKLVKYWKDAHADLVYMDAITQNCTLFPTALSDLAPNLGGRDLMRQFTDACTEFDIRCGVYVTPLEHTLLTRGHDDWCQTQTNGTRHDGPSWAGDNWYWACWNSPFVDRMCELLRDLLGRYPRIELVQYDGLLSRWGVCHCPSCKRKYRDEFGRDLPATHDRRDENFRNYVAWKFRTITEAARKLDAAIRHKNPGVLIDTNTPAAWCGWCAVQPEDFLDEVGEACVETFPGFHSVTMPGYVHSPSVGTTAYSINYTRSQMTGSPKVVAYYAIGDCTGWTAANIDIDVMLELKSAMAFGGLVNLQFEQPAVKPTFEYIGRCQPYLEDTTPLMWCAMAASQISCDTQHGDRMLDYFEDLKGSFQALMDAHLPVEFVSGKGLTKQPLDPYAVMVLSDVGYLTDAQADRVRKFVANGGGLVATHQSSLVGEDGLAKEDFLLADVLGVHAAAAPDWEARALWPGQTGRAYLHFETGQPWWGDAAVPWFDPAAGDLQAGRVPWQTSPAAQVFHAPFQSVRVDPSARVLACIKPLHDVDQVVQGLPGIVEHAFGKGKVIYFAPRLGQKYARFPLELWRRVLEQAVRRVANRPPPVEVQGPLCVSAACWDQPDQDRWVVHLINDLDETGRPRIRMTLAGDVSTWSGNQPRTRIIPVDGVELLIRRPGATAAHLPLEGRQLPVEKTDQGLRIKVGRVEQHCMIVIK